MDGKFLDMIDQDTGDTTYGFKTSYLKTDLTQSESCS